MLNCRKQTYMVSACRILSDDEQKHQFFKALERLPPATRNATEIGRAQVWLHVAPPFGVGQEP